MTMPEIIGTALTIIGALCGAVLGIVKFVYSQKVQIEKLKESIVNKSIEDLNQSVATLGNTLRDFRFYVDNRLTTFSEEITQVKISLSVNAIEVKSTREAYESGMKHWFGELEKYNLKSNIKHLGGETFRVESKPGSKEGK
jgi:hypothetical protein